MNNIIRIVAPLNHRIDQHTKQMMVRSMIKVVEELYHDCKQFNVVGCDFDGISPSIDVKIVDMSYIDRVKLAGDMISEILSKKRISAYFVVEGGD